MLNNIAVIISHINTPGLAEHQQLEIDNMATHFNVFIEQSDIGKLDGHITGLKKLNIDDYDYIIFNQPDISFVFDMDCLSTLINVMSMDKDLGLVAPVETINRRFYPDMHKKNNIYHCVGLVDYLCLCIPTYIINEIGFLNPMFIYGAGAEMEYCYKIWKHGYKVAYCDTAKIFHFGGTTYGNNGNVSRFEYEKQRILFARNYFKEVYGKDWDKKFANELPTYVWDGCYKLHKRGQDNWFIRNNRIIDKLLAVIH